MYPGDFHVEQRRDPKLKQLIDYLEKGSSQVMIAMQEKLLHKPLTLP